jgi:hypothetical protein
MNYTEEQIEELSEGRGDYDKGFAAAYFLGSVYVISVEQGDDPVVSWLQSTKLSLDSSGKIEVVEKKKITPVQASWDWQYAYHVAVVHHDRLFVFSAETSYEYIYYRYTEDGKTWSGEHRIDGLKTKKPIKGDTYNPTGSPALPFTAQSLGDQLYVLIPNGNGEAGLAVLSDTNNQDTWKTYDKWLDWAGITEIYGCTYAGVDGKPNMMLAIVDNGEIITNWWEYDPAKAPEGNDGLVGISSGGYDGYGNFKMAKSNGSPSCALIQGSLKGQGTGYVVQLIINTTPQSPEQQQICEFDIQKNKWGQLSDMPGGTAKTKYMIGACHYPVITPSTGEGVPSEAHQQVWIFTEVKSTGYATNRLCKVRRWDSDQLKKEGEPISGDLPASARNLIGVVEGPPPYFLNREPFKSSVSSFTFSSTSTQAVKSTTAIDIKTQAVFGGSVAGVTAQATLVHEFVKNTSDTKTITQEIDITIPANLSVNQATSFSGWHTISRQNYSLCDWSGATIEPKITTAVFSVDVNESSVHTDVHDMAHYYKSPDSNKLDSWFDRYDSNALPAFVTRQFDLKSSPIAGDKYVAKFKESDSDSTYESNKYSVEVKGGVKDVFTLGETGAVTISYSQTTTFTQGLSYTINCPTSSGSKTSSDIQSLDLRMFLFTPNQDHIDDCYWVPQGSGQLPWLAAWSVDSASIKHYTE